MSLKSSYSKKIGKIFPLNRKKVYRKIFCENKKYTRYWKKDVFLENNFKTIKQMFQ